MFSLSIIARSSAALALSTLAACVGVASKPDDAEPPPAFYTVTAEIALSRHEARVAALQYAAAAESGRDVGLVRRAAQVTEQCQQPSLTAGVAARWLELDSADLDAHRSAGRAALDLFRIDQAAQHYRVVLKASPRGLDEEFAALETELTAENNVYGARQLADKLAEQFPASPGALRLQAFTALRADDPGAAVKSFRAALAALPVSGMSDGTDAAAAGAARRRELTQGLWRARILSGDRDESLAEAQAWVARDGSAENRLDYALVLLAAQESAAVRAQLKVLADDADAKPVALRLLGLIEFQEGHLDEAGVNFAELLVTGKFSDDALYHLAMIAERHQDWERALRLYSDVQNGANAVPSLLRAAALLRAHGAAPAADDLLDQLLAEEPERAPEIVAARARIAADAGDLPQAIAVLQAGEREYPDSVDLHYASASMAEEQGRITAALAELKAVAAQRPSDPAALNAYGYTLADSNRDLPQARRLIERAYAAAPKNAAILDSLGWVLFRQGHAEQALPYLTAAYADDRGGDVAAHLGEVLWRQGQRAEAERIWAEASGGSDSHLLNATRLRLHAAN